MKGGSSVSRVPTDTQAWNMALAVRPIRDAFDLMVVTILTEERRRRRYGECGDAVHWTSEK